MAHPQITRAEIEGIEFTLYYDYDELRDRKLYRLTDPGKIRWFRLRMEFVFLEPLTRLYSGRTPALRALNSLKKNEQPPSSFVIPAFSVLLNGIEALGSFLTASGSSQVRFYAFVETYMESWDTTVAKSPYATSNDLKEILWKHFRNGIAHGFCIERGGIDNEADAAQGGWQVVDGRLLVGPHAFFEAFRIAVDSFFRDAATVHLTTFLPRFRKVYPPAHDGPQRSRDAGGER